MQLFVSIDNVVVGQECRNCWIAGIRFHYCLKYSITLGKDGSREESSLNFVEVLLLGIFQSKVKILCEVDQRTFFSTLIDN